MVAISALCWMKHQRQTVELFLRGALLCRHCVGFHKSAWYILICFRTVMAEGREAGQHQFSLFEVVSRAAVVIIAVTGMPLAVEALFVGGEPTAPEN